jgi:hypothetical protein
VLVLAAAALAVASTSAGAHASTPALPALQTTTLSQHGVRVLARLPWQARRYIVNSGEEVRVSVSPAYASDPQAGQRWAEFFASLPHNAELARLDAYIAPLDEVEQICGGEAFGCYGSNHLVTMGEANSGVTAQSVATHEYGHHVAQNRINPPWLAIDWGTKRWASVVGVCARQRDGTAFPGDEDVNYTLNPGEAFAESYRALVETNGTGVGYDWPLVDDSFRPTPEALAAVREDVAHPWVAPSTATISGRFAGAARAWTTSVATPLDGDLRIQVGAAADVKLLAGDAVLAKSSWTSSGGKALEYRICGTRSLKVRVSRTGAAARFTLRITEP